MTRNEFLETVYSLADLMDVLSDNDCMFLARDNLGFIDVDEFDECVLEDIKDNYTEETWDRIADRLTGLPAWDRDGWYIRDGMFDYIKVEDGDDYYTGLYQDTLDYFDQNDYWDEPEDEEDEEEPDEEQEDAVDDASIYALLNFVSLS